MFFAQGAHEAGGRAEPFAEWYPTITAPFKDTVDFDTSGHRGNVRTTGRVRGLHGRRRARREQRPMTRSTTDAGASSIGTTVWEHQ